MGFNRYSVFQCTVLSHVNRCTYIRMYNIYVLVYSTYVHTMYVCTVQFMVGWAQSQVVDNGVLA